MSVLLPHSRKRLSSASLRRRISVALTTPPSPFTFNLCCYHHSPSYLEDQLSATLSSKHCDFLLPPSSAHGSASIAPSPDLSLCGRPLCGSPLADHPLTAVFCPHCHVMAYCSPACRALDAVGPLPSPPSSLQDDVGHTTTCASYATRSLSTQRAVQMLAAGDAGAEISAERLFLTVWGSRMVLSGIGDATNLLDQKSGTTKEWDCFEELINLGLVLALGRVDDRHKPNIVLDFLLDGIDLFHIEDACFDLIHNKAAYTGLSFTCDKDIRHPMAITNIAVLHIYLIHEDNPLSEFSLKKAALAASIFKNAAYTFEAPIPNTTPIGHTLLALTMAHIVTFDISAITPADGEKLGISRATLISSLDAVWDMYHDDPQPIYVFLAYRALIYKAYLIAISRRLFGNSLPPGPDGIEGDLRLAFSAFQTVFSSASPFSVFHAQAMAGMALTGALLIVLVQDPASLPPDVSVSRCISWASSALAGLNPERQPLWCLLAHYAIFGAWSARPFPQISSLPSLKYFAALTKRALALKSDLGFSPPHHLHTLHCIFFPPAARALTSALRTEPFDVEAFSLASLLHHGDRISNPDLRFAREAEFQMAGLSFEALLASPTPDIQRAYSDLRALLKDRIERLDGGDMFRYHHTPLYFGLLRLIQAGDSPFSPPEKTKPKSALSAEDLLVFKAYVNYILQIVRQTVRQRQNRQINLLALLMVQVNLSVQAVDGLSDADIDLLPDFSDEECSSAWYHFSHVLFLNTGTPESLFDVWAELDLGHPEWLTLSHRAMNALAADQGNLGDTSRLPEIFTRFLHASLESQYYQTVLPWWTYSDALAGYVAHGDAGVISWARARAALYKTHLPREGSGPALVPNTIYVAFHKAHTGGIWNVVAFGVDHNNVALGPKVTTFSGVSKLSSDHMDAIWFMVSALTTLHHGRRSNGSKVVDVALICPQSLIADEIHTKGTTPLSWSFISSLVFLRSHPPSPSRSDPRGNGSLADPQEELEVLASFNGGPQAVLGPGPRNLAGSAVALADGSRHDRLVYIGPDVLHHPSLASVPHPTNAHVVVQGNPVHLPWDAKVVLGLDNELGLAELVSQIDLSPEGWQSGTLIARSVMKILRRWANDATTKDVLAPLASRVTIVMRPS